MNRHGERSERIAKWVRQFASRACSSVTLDGGLQKVFFAVFNVLFYQFAPRRSTKTLQRCGHSVTRGTGFAESFLARGHRTVKSKLAVWFSAVFILSSASSFAAVKPIDEIRVIVTRVTRALKEPETSSKQEPQKLLGRLAKIIDPIFDFEEMAKRSLGPHWRSLTPEQRGEFVPLFRQFLAKAYLGRIASHKNQKVFFARETVGRDYSEVDTQVTSANDDQIPIVYLLKLTDGDWKVYDVIIDNVSIVSNYRAQFDRVISQSSYQELVRRIKQKTEES